MCHKYIQIVLDEIIRIIGHTLRRNISKLTAWYNTNITTIEYAM